MRLLGKVAFFLIIGIESLNGESITSSFDKVTSNIDITAQQPPASAWRSEKAIPGLRNRSKEIQASATKIVPAGLVASLEVNGEASSAIGALQSARNELQQKVQPTATLQISTSSLPAATVGVRYSATLQASGGKSNYTWSLSSGTLPAGLTLSQAGVLSGTPTKAGNSSFTVSVKDSSSPAQTAKISESLTVGAALSISTGTLSSGQVGKAYSVTLQATGGKASYSWSVASGSLPSGVTLTKAGVLSGTPTTAGTSSFAIAVTDSESPAQTVKASKSLTVAPRLLAISTQSLAAAQTGKAYSATLAATGGTPSFTWAITAGALPTGVTLSTAGVLSGTPMIAGTSSFSVTATDSTKPAQTQTAALSLTVNQTQSPVPADSVFAPPEANACQSNYDKFYEGEPGVYAYWGMCESGSPVQIYDYVGTWDLTKAAGTWGDGAVGGAPGPVPDGETASFVTSAEQQLTNQGIPVNANAGTIAAWISSESHDYPFSAVYLGSVGGSSNLALNLVTIQQQLCFMGSFTSNTGAATTIQSCGYTPKTWYRVLLTWNNGALTLYVNGAQVATGTYTGKFDNSVFYYRLFPGCCPTDNQMSLAKVALSNRAWSASDISADMTPNVLAPPTGGVYVSAQQLGTIHKNVLGYADYNENMDDPSVVSSLQSALAKTGVTAVRQANGYGGISADLEDWKTGNYCTGLGQSGVLNQPMTATTGDTIDTYLSQVAQTLKLNTVFTVNYGSNPPYCDAGGDPVVNGANLVQYTNVDHNYNIKYWEIGNEQYSSTTETDFHPNPNMGASYSAYEPAFYSAMKAVDPTIQIAIPASIVTFNWAQYFTLPALASASYDAIVFHNYPMQDPITDGATLYQDRVASNLSRTRGQLLALQTTLLSNNKAPDAIWITEWNGEALNSEWSKQTSGAAAPMFTAMELAEYMQAGVQLATWWHQGMTDVCSTYNYDGEGDSAYSWWECGDSSLAYTGLEPGIGEMQVGFKAGDLTPTARAFQLLSQSGFVTEGEHMLRTYSDSDEAPWLLSYAATHSGKQALILINRDRDSAHVVPVQLAGAASGNSAQQWTYGRAQFDATQSGNWEVEPVQQSLGPWSGTLNVVLPAWSVNVIVLQ